MSKNYLLTDESKRKLEEELEYLTSTKRVEIAENLKIAAEYGDLKENAEFEAEKENQALVESRIIELQNILMNATIVTESTSIDKISLGNEITLFDYEFNEQISYTIVDSVKSDPFIGLISYDSPMGRALIDKKIDDIVEVDLPYGKAKYKIIDIK